MEQFEQGIRPPKPKERLQMKNLFKILVLAASAIFATSVSAQGVWRNSVVGAGEVTAFARDDMAGGNVACRVVVFPESVIIVEVMHKVGENSGVNFIVAGILGDGSMPALRFSLPAQEGVEVGEYQAIAVNIVLACLAPAPDEGVEKIRKCLKEKVHGKVCTPT